MGASPAEPVPGLVPGRARNGAVSELEHAQAALAETEARFGLLAQLAPVGIVQSDPAGRVIFVNDRWCAMTGVPAPEMRGADWLGLFHPDDRARIEQDLAGARGGDVQIDGRLRPPSGAEVWVQGSAVALPAPAPGGGPAGLLAAFTDISDRKRAEAERERLLAGEQAARRTAELAQRQLQQQNEKLQELGEARFQFVATVSHELRTPLTSIVSFIELIRAEAGGLSKDGTYFLDIIQRNAHRLLRLVGDLLLLSRVESGTMPLELAPVSIPEVIAEASRDASAPAAGFGISLDVSAGDGPAVPADQLRLLQVLDNLIANAVKFSHPGDQVRVRAAWEPGAREGGAGEGGAWRIDVTDSGIGIPPDELGQLFDRFVRASNARTSGRPGTGLGLSVVKAIVELHGGRIGVDSTLDRGTTFSVYLPGAP